MPGVNGPLFADPTDLVSSNKILSYLLDAAGAALTSTLVGGLQALDVNIAADLPLQAAVDSVAAWANDGAGTAITSTLVSGKQGLDVNVISAISVDLNGIYNVSTNPTPDNVGIIANVRSATPGLTGQSNFLTSATAASDGVVAANVQALDVNSFLMGYNGTTWDRLHSTSGALNVQVSNTATISTSQSYSSWKAAGGTVTTTAAALPTSALANRRLVSVYNNGNKAIFVGELVGVTASSGFPVYPGVEEDFALESGAVLFAVAASGSQDVRVAEFAKA